MSRRQSFGNQFEKLRSLGAQKPLDEQKQPIAVKSPLDAVVESLPGRSPILEETRSSIDTVQNRQCSERIESKLDTVQSGQCPEPTESTVNSLAGGFTRVPHSLLRGEAKFSEPLDFMIYMHLFTYSHGFGRREAHMSQGQLASFSGAAKNTIKRSLERLVKQGWIKCIEEYERSRMSRKWRVLTPEDRSGRPGPGGKRTGSKSDSVQNEHCPARTDSLSTVDPLTGSKMDTFLERNPKEKSKNSLSAETPVLCEYFATVKPTAKRESEWKAFQELKQEYAEEQIAACAEYLQEKGIPISGAPCHSPMGFLSKAMGQVWELVRVEREKRERIATSVQVQAGIETRRLAEEQKIERDIQARESAFLEEFPDESEQEAMVAQYGGRFPMLGRSGAILRNLAVIAWWEDRKEGISQLG